MVMAYYGRWVPLEQVRVDCGVSRNGSNAKNILAFAKKRLKGFAFTQELASSNKPRFDISIVATDGVHNSELNGSVSLAEFDHA